MSSVLLQVSIPIAKQVSEPQDPGPKRLVLLHLHHGDDRLCVHGKEWDEEGVGWYIKEESWGRGGIPAIDLTTRVPSICPDPFLPFSSIRPC